MSERSRIKKRSARIGKHRTHLTIEDEFWEGLIEIARERNLPLSNLLADIDSYREHANFSSAVRLFVLDHYRRLAEAKR